MRESPHAGGDDYRLFFVQLYRWFPSILEIITAVRPETLVRGHRAGFRRYWRWKSPSLGGRPRIGAEQRALIRRMSLENPLWGAPRIHGELLKLGFAVAQSTIAKYMAWRSGELARSCPRGALLFTASLTAQDPWRQKLIAAVFDDFEPFDRKPSG